MSTITLRATKGSPLTNTEVDTNFSNLNTDKLESTYSGAMNSLTGGTSIATVGTVTAGTWSATAIGATKGGTGQTTYAAGDILYASATNTLSKLAKPASAAYLKMASDGTPSWDALGLDDITATGTVTTGTWNASVIGAAYGGTGIANNAANTTAFTGNYSLGLTLSANTSLTLPTTGTVATVAGSEALTNKSINGLTVSTTTGTLTLANSSTLATSGAYSTTLTATATTTLTLPTTGTLATLAGSETLTNKTLSAATLTSTLTAGGSAGTNGQLLASTGSGVQWTTPSYASTGKAIAMAMVFGG